MLNSDNLDNIFDAYIALLGGIIGIGFPIILTVISGLDQKYDSTSILKLYKKEKSYKLFFFVVLFNLLALFIFLLNISTRIDLLSNSRYILIFTTLFALLSTFGWLVYDVLIYLDPEKLVEKIRMLFEESNSSISNEYFQVLQDFMIYCVKKQNITLGKTLQKTIYFAFDKVRNSKINEDVVYPDKYYSLVNEIVDELLVTKINKLKYLQSRTVGGIWLLGEVRENQKISSRTYMHLWINLKKAIENGRDDMVYDYWETANMYFQRNFDHINFNELELKNNALEFKEFNLALCAFVFDEEKYHLLKRMYFFSTSTPPEYYLSLNYFSELVDFYVHIFDAFDQKDWYFSYKYSFIKAFGIAEDAIIKNKILDYVVISLYRLYQSNNGSLGLNSIFNTNILPEKKLRVLKEYESSVRNMLRRVEKHFNEKPKFIEELGFSNILESGIANIENPRMLLSNYLKKIKDLIENIRHFGALDYKKIDLYLAKYQSNFANLIDNLEFSTKSSLHTKKLVINGSLEFLPKDAFSVDTDSEWMDLHEVLFFRTQNNLYSKYTEILRSNLKRNYLIGITDLNIVLNKLLNKDTNYSVLGFNPQNLKLIDCSKLINTTLLKVLINEEYDSIFILKSEDLPLINWNKPAQEYIDKYNLHPLGKEKNIYGNIVPIKDFPELYDNINDQNFNPLENVAFINSYNLEISIKEKFEVVRVDIKNPYFDKGLADNIDNIKPIE